MATPDVVATYPEGEPWTCPQCKAQNWDDEDLTVFPMCGACETEFEWDDIRNSPKKS